MHYDCYFYIKRYPAVNALITILATSLQLNEMGAMFVNYHSTGLTAFGASPVPSFGSLFTKRHAICSTNLCIKHKFNA